MKRQIISAIVGAVAGLILGLTALHYQNGEAVQEREVIPIEKLASKPEPVFVLDEVMKTPEPISLGEYKLTAYCPCKKCCGKCDGITASGTKATEGRTIGVDPDVIPYGTKIIINGQEYIAEDCGGAVKDNCIDIFFDSHETALNFGIQYAEVFEIIEVQ